MLSYASGTSDVPLLGETIGANLERTVAAFGDREALVDVPSGRRWTYAQFDDAVNEVACGLLARGINKGDRVGIWAPNCAEWVITQYATAKIGAILVNVNPAYRTHELAYVVRQSGLRLLISAVAFKTSDYRGMIAEIGFTETIFIGTPDWAELIAAGEGRSPAERAATLAFDDPINIQYTSGTTGFPKGATLSHHNILNNGFFVGELVGYTEADRICIPVPLYHCFGMVMGNLAATTHGACMVLPAQGFDPAASLRTVATEKCTSLYGVPTMFIAELGLPDFADYDLSSLRTGIMAGSPCPVEVMKRVVAEMHMTEVAICYGMTAEAIDAARWMHTGDLATMDEDGYLNIVGRIKDLVIRGGENVYPREVEEFLHTHPDVTDVQVIGVPDEKYGEELMAWVVLRPDAAPLTAEAVREFCAGKLAHYKVPRYVHVVEGFPMTVTGKVRKVEMREQAVEILDLGDAAEIRNA
jgi:acyl-CoA synthetase (AMP-forming)/AMP-acid ligase II